MIGWFATEVEGAGVYLGCGGGGGELNALPVLPPSSMSYSSLRSSSDILNSCLWLVNWDRWCDDDREVNECGHSGQLKRCRVAGVESQGSVDKIQEPGSTKWPGKY